MSSDDASLRRFASQRGEDSFRELTRQTTPALYRFLARLLGSGDPALLEELAQRTYIVVARKASHYRGPSATSWILGIAFREVRSHRRELCRQRAREVEMTDEEMSGLEATADRRPIPRPDELAEASEQVQLLRDALERLETKERVVLELVHLEALAYADVAGILDVPVGTVKSRAHRALGSLRRRLGSREASCLALLGPPRAAELGPAVAIGLAARADETSATALAAARAGASPDAGPEGATPAPQLATAGGPAALWLTAGILAVAAAPVIVWLGARRDEPTRVDAPRGERSAAIATGGRSAPAEPGGAAPAPVPETRLPAMADSAADAPRHFWARGVVRDAQGRPLAGVTVAVDDAWDGVRNFPGDPVQVMVWVRRHCEPFTTGPDGRFEVAFLERSQENTVLTEYQSLAAEEHEVHLTATTGTGDRRIVCLRTRPIDPPEVEVSFAPLGSLRGKVTVGTGVPALQGVAAAAVQLTARTACYERFARAELAPDATFRFDDLEPGPWQVYLVHLPRSTVVMPAAAPEVQIGGGATAELELAVASDRGLAGRIASAGGHGLAGAVLRVVDATGAELASTVLEATLAGRVAPGGDLLRKGPAGAIDVAATPTPFRFADVPHGEGHTLLLESPPGVAVERFGPFAAPAANLDLRAGAIELEGKVRCRLIGIDPPRGREGRATLFAGPRQLATGGMHDGDETTGERNPVHFCGLAAGTYTIEVTVRERWDSYDHLRGAVTFELAAREEKVVDVVVGKAAGLLVTQDAALRALRAERDPQGQGYIHLRRFIATPLGGAGPCSPLVGYGAEGEERTLRFGLPPGSYALRLPVEGDGGRTTRHVGSLMRIEVPPAGPGLRLHEPPAAATKLGIAVPGLGLRMATLNLSGRTAQGYPLEVGPLLPTDDRFEVLGLPPGTYRLTLDDAARGDAPLDMELAFDGGDVEIEWAAAGARE